MASNTWLIPPVGRGSAGTNIKSRIVTAKLFSANTSLSAPSVLVSSLESQRSSWWLNCWSVSVSSVIAPRQTVRATVRIMEHLHGLPVPRTLEEACDPRRLALVVYDMQAGILGQIGDRERVVAQVVRTLEAARAAHVRTVFMRHVTLPTALMGAAQLRMWMSWHTPGVRPMSSRRFRPTGRRATSSLSWPRMRTRPSSTR